MVVENVNGTELRFKNPGSLLLIVFAFVFWGVGFLDLLGHKSAEPDLFGLYSFPLFIFIVIYGCSIVIWFALFFNANLLTWVSGRIQDVQKNTRLAILSFLGLGVALWVIFEWDRWARLPGLQFAAFGLLVLAFLILLFANWREGSAVQPWRRIIAYPLFILVALEALVQAAAWLGFLPGRFTIGGDFYPYERIYYNQTGVHSGFANRYGLYFPDEDLANAEKRILVVGGSFVQSIQTRPEQQFGERWEELVNQDVTERSRQTEVIPIGMPGFGPSPFLYEDSISELPTILDIDEMVIVFHLGDDFQSPADGATPIRYTVEDSGIAVHPEDARLRHDLTHYYLRGYMSLQLVETFRSNYLTPKVLSAWLQSRSDRTASASSDPEGGQFPRQVGFVTDMYDVTEPGHAGIKTTDLKVIPGGNDFMFTHNLEMEEATLIADGLLAKAQEIARDRGIPLRIVTVPEFPEQFFELYAGGTWEPQVGDYDLFLPERALVEIAEKHGIPILPMGQYMLADGLNSEQIRLLFLPGVSVGFTPEGHAYFAQAIHSCFYSAEESDLCPE
jgi:hypothetical protein